MTNVENCVVRTYPPRYENSTLELKVKMSAGWIVKSNTPIVKDGTTICIEYVLERVRPE